MRHDASLDHRELTGIGTTYKSEICGYLNQIPLTQDLDQIELDALVDSIRTYLIPAGEVLFKEGSPAGYLGIVLQGKMRVEKRNDSGEARELYLMGPGKVFGEMAIVDQEPRSATLITIDECVLAVLSRDNFTRLCQDKPGIGVKLLLKISRVLSQRLRRMSGLLVDRI
ncbi:cyclic nucleotide-binding domain-containing protein [Andreprevotia chitinilytica]|uniref:cyclic nucleotide-binding domain-containing protein n=1 Tax=Andreprevotia chitinilytica TaxID=396808 RepID=UPI00069204C5|nr:cyclic nucleotide-binding domain-containing protein [Andreprevotia chitinilytica]